MSAKPNDPRLNAALIPHHNAHARHPDGCPLELDRLHVIDRDEWWITKRGQILHVSEMRTPHIIDAVQILVRYAIEGKIDTFVPWWEDIESIDAPESEKFTETDLWKSRTYKALICELVQRGVLDETALLYHRH